jgi:hypothetical protein
MLTLLSLVLAAAATLNPAISISVQASPNISPALVAQTFHEAAAIWTPAGVMLQWDLAVAGRQSIAMLSVTFDEDTRAEAGRPLPIGWVVFDAGGVPQPEIHLSYANALALVQATEGPGAVGQMTMIELWTLLSRALGRALAHELGHYLLASKAHTSAGLMKASRPAREFLDLRRDGFAIDPALRLAVDAQLKLQETVAQR